MTRETNPKGAVMARGKNAGSTGGKGDEGNEPDAPKRAPVGPRDYIVCREYTVAELVELVNASAAEGAETVKAVGPDTKVLVELGPAKGRTPKEARIAAAKSYIDEAELTTETGVMLNAVPERALTTGRNPVKMKNEPKFDA